MVDPQFSIENALLFAYQTRKTLYHLDAVMARMGFISLQAENGIYNREDRIRLDISFQKLQRKLKPAFETSTFQLQKLFATNGAIEIALDSSSERLVIHFPKFTHKDFFIYQKKLFPKIKSWNDVKDSIPLNVKTPNNAGKSKLQLDHNSEIIDGYINYLDAWEKRLNFAKKAWALDKADGKISELDKLKGEIELEIMKVCMRGTDGYWNTTDRILFKTSFDLLVSELYRICEKYRLDTEFEKWIPRFKDFDFSAEDADYYRRCLDAHFNDFDKTKKLIKVSLKSIDDGIDLINFAHKNTIQILIVLNRAKEVAEDAKSKKHSNEERRLMQVEFFQLLDESSRLLEVAIYNKKHILNKDHKTWRRTIPIQVDHHSSSFDIYMPRVDLSVYGIYHPEDYQGDPIKCIPVKKDKFIPNVMYEKDLKKTIRKIKRVISRFKRFKSKLEFKREQLNLIKKHHNDRLKGHDMKSILKSIESKLDNILIEHLEKTKNPIFKITSTFRVYYEELRRISSSYDIRTKYIDFSPFSLTFEDKINLNKLGWIKDIPN